MAPRFSTAQFTRSGAKEYGRNRLYPVIVGVVNTVIGMACSTMPARKFLPVGDSGSPSSFVFMNAGAPSFVPRNDWWRCQPLEKKLGKFGRHMNVAWKPFAWQIC